MVHVAVIASAGRQQSGAHRDAVECAVLISLPSDGVHGLAMVDQSDGRGFGMAIVMFVSAAALFALLWLAIDSNRFHVAGRATSAVSAATPATTTTPRPQH